VLRRGQIVGQANTKDIDKNELAKMMIGRAVQFHIKKKPLSPAQKILAACSVTIHGDKGNVAVSDLSFDIYGNEIFGIAGVAGNGQKELIEALTGLRQITSGDIFIQGENVANLPVKFICSRGVAHVPEERIKYGIAPALTLYDNAILKMQDSKKFGQTLLLAYDRIKAHCKKLIHDFSIAAPSIDSATKNLSGGNIQKLILGRELFSRPALLVASHPTYGLDVGASEFIRNMLLKRRREGGAILLVSEDLDELFQLCDRIGVMYKGKFMGILTAKESETADIRLMMAGTELSHD
jgi:simple sugar transport system ATP-binding protein